MDRRKKQFVINTLRKASYRWPTRSEAEKRSRVDRGLYKCENPKCGHIGPRKDFVMDHVIPVVDPVEGFVSFDVYIERMFPDSAKGWQRLCHQCHDIKTETENSTRKISKKQSKLTKY
jgi:5-methylcytosine-specific restriction endonuclease McrA